MNKKIQLVVLFLSIFIVVKIHGQSAIVDSLEKVLKFHKTEDTVKVNLINKIAYSVYKDHVEKTRSYATQAGKLSEKLGFKEGKAESIWLIALSYADSDKPLSFDYFQKALKMNEDIGYRIGIARCLNGIGSYYKTKGDVPKAIGFYQRGIKVAKDLDDKLELAKCWLNLSNIYKKQDKYDLAIEGYQTALKIFVEKDDKSNSASCLNSLGVMFSFKGNHPISLEYFQKYLKIQEIKNDATGIMSGMSNIGNVYLSLSDYPKALEHYQKALNIAVKTKNKRMIAGCYGNIGTTYQRMNNMQALEYFQKALLLSEAIGEKMITVSVLIYIGDYYLPKDELDKALGSYLKALKISEENGMRRPACAAMNNVGTIYLKQKKYATALTYTLKGLKIADELKVLNTQKDIHFQLSEIYSATKDYKKAYLNHKMYKELNDSLFGDETVRKITALEYTYKFEKEKQTAELLQQKKNIIQSSEKKQQRIIIGSLVVGILLMSLIVIHVYKSSLLKQQTNILLTKQKDEIEQKNEELLQLNEEISNQKDEITTINAEIEKNNIKLQELNATKDKFFGIIAHDLKNPFHAILGFTEMLNSSENQHNQEQTLEIIGILHSSAQSAYNLLENLLEWSRSQTGGIEFRPKNILLKDLVVENENLTGNIAREKNISIGIQIPEDLIVCADQNMLSAILRNLITNAIKFTHRGGNITITSTRQNAYIVISVRDTGIGMSEITKNKLFKINEKTSIAGTEKESGTGLGLMLCKEFSERHGGKIWVETELNKGSEFKFSIPYNGNL